MEGMKILEPNELYNMLNQKTVYPALSDPNYMLLLDARKKHEYNESHIVTAKKAPKNEKDEFVVPYDAELECKQYVVVYDGRTQSLKEDSPAIACAKQMWTMGSRNPVLILKGGYEAFSALYPFLRTQKMLYMLGELDSIQCYPIEMIPGLLYLGDWTQANAAYIQKDLKVKGHINCCVEEETFFKADSPSLLHIPIRDSEESDLGSKFQTICDFIDNHKSKQEVALVFSTRGISRSACVAVAYLMHYHKISLKEAWSMALACCSNLRPNRAFVQQLSTWEQELFGEKKTDIQDPNF